MLYEVKATLIALKQIAALRGPRRKAFEVFVVALSGEGCKALGYRLTDDDPLPRLCVKNLRANDRVVVAFEGAIAWVLLVGPHEEGDRRADIYTALYDLAGVERPQQPRSKPPCCGEDGTAPSVATADINDLVQRTRAIARAGRESLRKRDHLSTSSGSEP